MNELLFLDPREIETGFLSNFYGSEFILDNAQWPTVEHYYQANKFTAPTYIEHIRLAATPRAAKNLGQTRDVPMRADWESYRMTAMLRALASKFTQHQSLQQKLLATGDALLIEASPHDSFWGHGPDGHGENRLGYLVTTLRDQLRSALAQMGGTSADPEAFAQQCFMRCGRCTLPGGCLTTCAPRNKRKCYRHICLLMCAM